MKKAGKELDANEFAPIQLNGQRFLMDGPQNNIGDTTITKGALQLGGADKILAMENLKPIAKKRSLSLQGTGEIGAHTGAAPDSVDVSDHFAVRELSPLPAGGRQFAQQRVWAVAHLIGNSLDLFPGFGRYFGTVGQSAGNSGLAQAQPLGDISVGNSFHLGIGMTKLFVSKERCQ